jgi:hypothetical protein
LRFKIVDRPLSWFLGMYGWINGSKTWLKGLLSAVLKGRWLIFSDRLTVGALSIGLKI